MTRAQLENKISDWQGRVLHWTNEREAAAKRKDAKMAAQAENRRLGALECLNALYAEMEQL